MAGAFRETLENRSKNDGAPSSPIHRAYPDFAEIPLGSHRVYDAIDGPMKRALSDKNRSINIKNLLFKIIFIETF